MDVVATDVRVPVHESVLVLVPVVHCSVVAVCFVVAVSSTKRCGPVLVPFGLVLAPVLVLVRVLVLVALSVVCSVVLVLVFVVFSVRSSFVRAVVFCLFPVSVRVLASLGFAVVVVPFVDVFLRRNGRASRASASFVRCLPGEVASCKAPESSVERR